MKHSVEFNLPTCELGKADIHITVHADGAILGKLEVSKGALNWYPNGTTIGHKMSWVQFDAVMKDYPRVERRKKSNSVPLAACRYTIVTPLSTSPRMSIGSSNAEQRSQRKRNNTIPMQVARPIDLGCRLKGHEPQSNNRPTNSVNRK